MAVHRRRLPIVLAAAWVGLLVASCPPAQAEDDVILRLGPDFLQTLGVGSRSVAMGNAFTAIADDASATFWNPARLPDAGRRNVMLEWRSVVLSQYSVRNSVVGGQPTTPLSQVGIRAGDPQFGFGGFVYPLSRPKAGGGRYNYGTLGVSYTLGGYFNYSRTSDISEVIDGATVLTEDRYRQTVRNQYFTVAWGHDTRVRFSRDEAAARARLGYGVGVYYLNNSQSRHTATSIYQDGDLIAPPTDIRDSDTGNALGYLLGVAFGTDNKVQPWKVGLTYRSGAHIDDLSEAGTSFGDSVPSRTSLGVAYQSWFANPNTPGSIARPITVSAEAQFFSGANTPNQTDYRRSVTNFHVGVEYGILGAHWVALRHDKSVPYDLFLRAGYHTNANAATSYTYYDDVFSLGLAYQRHADRGGLAFSIEPTAEILRQSGVVQWTLTGIVQF